MEEENTQRRPGSPSSTTTLPPTANSQLLHPNPGKDNASPLLSKTSSETEETEHKSPPEKSREIGGPWLLEWCALICCIASFGGLVALLFHYHNKRLSEWKWAISINTVISILAGVSKASLAFSISACIAQFKWNWFSKNEGPLIDFDRFDAASRGLWGSVRLIRTTMRRPHWIVLGAFATIVLPGFGPFLQALVRLEDETFVQAQNGTWTLESTARKGNSHQNDSITSGTTIGKSTNLRVGSYEQDARGTSAVKFTGPDGKEHLFDQLNFELGEIDFGMIAAIWNGLSGLIRPSDLWPSYACSSGNCTWDPYPSIAVCSKCNDISQHLTTTNGRVTLPDVVQTSSSDDGEHIPEISYPGGNGKNSTCTAWTVSKSGLNISNYDGPFYKPLSSACRSPPCESYYQTHMTAKVINNPGQTTSFQDLRTMLFAIQILQPQDSWSKNETLWQDAKVTAHECSLSFCVAAYESNIMEGKLVESVHTWNNRSPNSFEANSTTTHAYTQYQNYSLDLGNIQRSDLQLYIPEDSEKASPELQGQTFNISQSTIVSMIQELLRGFGAGDPGFQDNERNIPIITYPKMGSDGPPDFAVALSKSKNFSATFDNLALSLSKWIRDRASDEPAAFGYVTQSMVVIRINWYYITLPLITLGMGLVVVLLSIIDTTRKRLPVWKADVLVPLGYGTDMALHDRLGKATTEKDMYQMARETRISLKNEGGGRKLAIDEYHD